MNELVQIVQQKSGLSEEKSIEVVHAIIGFVKGRLPASLAAHVDSLVGDLGPATPGTETAAASEPGVAGLLSSVMGNIFGSKKEV